MTTRTTKQMRRFGRWLFGWPFQQSAAPPGNLVPAEIRVFEAKTAEIRHQKRGAIQIGAIRRWNPTTAVRR